MDSIAPAAAMSDRDFFAIFDYSNPLVSDAVWELKYHGKSETARALVDRAALRITKKINEQYTASEKIILVPLPQHASKTRARGYNQSALIAKWLARQIPHARIAVVLQKTIATVPQARIKHKAARLKNVEGTMKALRALDPHAIYVIVDDVTTTGATFVEARRALAAAGAQQIRAVALAHGYARKHRQ
jgi:ComF family protein